MKKVNDELYLYKGYGVIKDHKGYHARILIEDYTFPIEVDAPTQQGFKSIFNKVLKEYKVK